MKSYKEREENATTIAKKAENKKLSKIDRFEDF